MGKKGSRGSRHKRHHRPETKCFRTRSKDIQQGIRQTKEMLMISLNGEAAFHRTEKEVPEKMLSQAIGLRLKGIIRI